MLGAGVPGRGRDYAALLAGRRWVMVVVTVVTIAAFTLVLPLPLDSVPVEQRAMVAAMWTLAVVGLALSAREIGLWLLTGAILLLSLAGFLSSEPWTQVVPLVAVFEFALFVVVLTPRLIGVGVVAASAGALTTLSVDQAAVLEVGGWTVTSGSVRALQLLLSGAFLAYAWPLVVARAQDGDAQRDLSQRDLDDLLRLQERLRVWRDTAIRVHETTLNDIRYILTSEAIDGPRLAVALGPRPRAGRLEAVPGVSLRQVLDLSVAESGVTAEVAVDVPAARVEPDAVPYLRAALIEALRNARRHAAADAVTVTAEVERDAIIVTVQSPTAGIPVDAAAGIGRAIVLDEAMGEIGGSARVSAGGVILRLPNAPATADLDDRAEPGRIVASGVLAGVAVGAFPYPLSLLTAGGPMLATAGALALVVLAVAAGATLRRPQLPVAAAVALGALGAAVPLLMWGERAVCVDAPALAYVVDITGFALVSIAAWSPWRSALLVLLPWGAAAAAFVVVSPPVACRPIPLIALLASVLVALLMVGVLRWALPRSRRLSDEARALEEARVQEASRAEAALDMARTLDSSVTAAWDVMQDIARDGELDSERRDTLRRLEARIRATIQVDPRTSGSVTQMARQLVMRATGEGRALQVLSLRDSQDRRPLPGAIQEQLSAFIMASGTEPSIQAFAMDGADHLTVTGEREAAESAGLWVSASWRVGDAEVEVLEAEGSGRTVAVLVTRDSEDQGSSPSSRTTR